MKALRLITASRLALLLAVVGGVPSICLADDELRLTLRTAGCIKIGGQVIATLDVTGLTWQVNGIEVYLQFDPLYLTLERIEQGDGSGSPWDDGIVVGSSMGDEGQIVYAVVLVGGGTSADATVVRLVFTARAEGASTVDFVPPRPPFQTRLTTYPDSRSVFPITHNTESIDVHSLCCPLGAVIFLDPPNGVVDARQPHPPLYPEERQSIDAFLVETPAGAGRHWETCWSVCETAEDGFANAVTSVVDNGDGTFTIALARTITTGAVTAITYTDDNGAEQRGVFTSHPANVNADSQSAPSDILRVIDYINGVVTSPWGIYSEDVDHSGLLGPPDILRVIDLLNGAGVYDPWLNTALPECGACCP